MSEQTEKVIKSTKEQILARWMQLNDAVSALTDGELIDAVIEEIAGKMVFVSRENALLSELLDRFQVAIDLDETPKGITKDGEPVWPDVLEVKANEDD